MEVFNSAARRLFEDRLPIGDICFSGLMNLGLDAGFESVLVGRALDTALAADFELLAAALAAAA